MYRRRSKEPRTELRVIGKRQGSSPGRWSKETGRSCVTRGE